MAIPAIAGAPATGNITYNTPASVTGNASGAPANTQPGAVQTPYNFVPVTSTQYNSSGAPVTPGTLNANISTPTTNNNTIAPPAVITSSAAADDLANKQSQVSQLNQDVNSQAQSNASMSAPAPQTTPQTQANQSTSSSTTQSPSLDDQVNSLLGDLFANTQQINDDATNSENGLLNAQDQNQLQQNQQYAQTASQLKAIASGVYPLSPSEQGLLTSTASVFQQTIAAQQQANTAFTGQMTEAMASLGISTSAPTQAMGNIQAAINSGQSKIADLGAQMSQSLATLQQGFQKQDFDMVQSAWDDASKQFEDRQTELNSMLTTVQTEAKNQTDEIQAQTSTAITAYTSSANFDLTTAQDAIKNAFQQQTITETQRSDLANEAIAQANATKGVYSMTSTGQILDSRTGQIVATQQNNAAIDPSVIGNTGSPIVDANTMKTADGIPYVNGTNLTGAMADNAQLVAAQNGIPYLGSAAAAGMQQASTVTDTLNDIKAQLEPLQASNYVNRPLNSLANNAETATQANATLAAYKTFSATAIPLLKALANGASGFRITQTELNNVMANDLPSPNDTVAAASQKITNINQMLSNGERGIFGDQTYDSFNPTAAASDLATWAKQDPANASAVQSAQQAFPDMTPYQISQVVGAN